MAASAGSVKTGRSAAAGLAGWGGARRQRGDRVVGLDGNGEWEDRIGLDGKGIARQKEGMETAKRLVDQHRS